MCAFCYQLVLENLSLPFVQLEDRSVQCAIRVDIFQCNGVVLLMSKEANGSATSEWSGRLAYGHRRATDLFVCLAQKDILYRRNLDLRRGLSVFLELQPVVLN